MSSWRVYVVKIYYLVGNNVMEEVESRLAK